MWIAALFPIPEPWELFTEEALRDEAKRTTSPGSFFYAQGKSLCLASAYFSDDRLVATARGGVAKKHRHKMQLALFGQLMASFEYFLKDFVSKSVDSCNVLDQRIASSKWIEVSAERVLSNRSGVASAGSVLIHSTMGWHQPAEIKSRFKNLYGVDILDQGEEETLTKLWVLRHTVAHNAGWLIPYDAQRMGREALANRAANINADFIQETFNFLSGLSERTTESCGAASLKQWFSKFTSAEANVARDFSTYKSIRLLGTFVKSRPQSLPEITEAQYLADHAMYVAID